MKTKFFPFLLILVSSLVIFLFLFSCGGKPAVKDTDSSTDITKGPKSPKSMNENVAQKVLEHYTTAFSIPNPLYGGMENSRGFNQRREGSIQCWATLLDEYSSEADMAYQCLSDSLDSDACDSLKTHYRKHKIREDKFSIRIYMETGFSAKSVEPSLYTVFLETPKGVIIEPKDVVTSQVEAKQDSIYSEYYYRYVPRVALTRDITYYFDKVTFYGEELLGEENPYIILVVNHEKETLARVGWRLHERTDK
jgi:hypothetical protein